MISYSWYQFRTTLAHRTHPTVKIVWAFACWILAFALQDVVFNATLLLQVALLLGFARPSRSQIKNMIIFTGPIVVVILVSWPLVYGRGPILAQGNLFGLEIPVYANGIAWAGVQVLRYETILLSTFFLLMTTSDPELAVGAAKLRVPFIMTFIFTLSMRLISVTMVDLSTIYDAQRARALKAGGRKSLARRFVPLLIPLFMVSMRRIQTLGSALEVRGFVPGAPRSVYRTKDLRVSDVLLILLMISATLAILYGRFYLGMFSQFPGHL